MLDGAARCDMCGTNVPVGEDRRCRLGHSVELPPSLTADLAPFEADPAETGPPVPSAHAAAETPPPLAAASEARPAHDDPFFHPYDEVLADPPAAEAAATEPAPAEPAEPALAAPAPGLAPDELEDLLDWSNDQP